MLYPQNLNRLVEHLGLTIKFLDKVIDGHTFFPFYRSFLTKEQHQDYYQSMLDDSPKKNNKLTSIGGTKFISSEVRYCPVCLEQDVEQFGECFLHRTHQFSFLDVCPIHEVKLVSHCSTCNVSLVNQKASSMLFNSQCANGHNINSKITKSPLDPFMKNFLNDVNVFMNTKDISLEMLFHKLTSLLGNRGYIHFKGNLIYKKEILSDLIEFYNKDNLKRLGIEVEVFSRKKFVDQFIQREYSRKNIPLYLLLFRYLAGSASNFLNKNELYFNPLPFGPGPWKCINPICPHYNEAVINTCKRICREWVTGFFTCPHCGIKFTRRGFPNKEDENQYIIETMGSLFIDSAVRYYEKGLSTREIAKRLQSNKTTVTKYLKPFLKNLHVDENLIEIEAAKAVLEQGYREVAATVNSRENEYKETILQTIKELGEAAIRTRIKERNQCEYTWLMRHKRPWMEENLPPSKEFSNKINLEKIDDELYNLVDLAVKDIWSKLPPYRITKARILEGLPPYLTNAFRNHSKGLPKTRWLLDDNTELMDDYLVRGFPRVIQWFEETGFKRCNMNLLTYRFAAYKNCSPEVKQWVEKQIIIINDD